MPSAATNQTLRDGLFRPSENQTARQPTGTFPVLATKVRVYALPGVHADNKREVMAFHLYLIVSGTSPSEDRQEWRNYIATLVCLCFPDIRQKIVDNAAYEESFLSDEMLTLLMTWYDTYTTLSEAGDDVDLKAEIITTANAMVLPLSLPVGKASASATLSDVCDFEAIYGHLSLVLFLAGKRIDEKNRAAITAKRPGAIERKYYNSRAIASLTGALALSNNAHAQIHAAFAHLSHMRIVTFEMVAGFNQQNGDPRAEVVATNTRLMRFSGMQQAAIIDAFLSSHEEAFSVPMLAPAIASYTASLVDLAKVPDAVRPYFKIMYADATRAFNRNDVSHLICVALDDAIALNPTLGQYNKPPNYAEVVASYHRALALLADDE